VLPATVLFTLFNQPMYLDAYNNGGTPAHTIPNNSQFKCYDGMHNWNQVQPAPYDAVPVPSVTGINPTTGKPAGTNCTVRAEPAAGHRLELRSPCCPTAGTWSR